MTANIWGQLASFSMALFTGCMLCHGEIYRSRPHPKYLTLFYLTVSAGGALGGFCVAIIAPMIFASYWEYHWSLMATVVFVFVSWFRDQTGVLYRGRPVWAWMLLAVLSFVLAGSLVVQSVRQTGRSMVARNFFAALRIEDKDVDKPEHRRTLYHGRTMHGFQYADETRRHWPTSYYGRLSGIGLAIAEHPRREQEKGLRIGVIGLGTGTIAALAEPKDTLRFYEINPLVIEFAASPTALFTYLHDSAAENVEVVQGDARIQLERELALDDRQQFDVLAVDAFSSDSIPMHLLTLECARLYFEHLKLGGILALHISNRHLELEPVVQALAEQLNVQAVQVNSSQESAIGVDASDWVLLTSNQEFLESEVIQEHGEQWSPQTQRSVLWTDDYGSLWQVLRKPKLPELF